MKKQLFILLLALLPMMASADDSGSCGNNVTYIYVESAHTLTISGNGAMMDYNFPWRPFIEDITKVIIEDGITSIGNYAFSGCSGLTSVTIGNGVTSIGGYAFDGCSGLTSVTIPNSVTSIGKGAFNNCNGLTFVTIPNSVTSIGSGAFSGCNGLTSIAVEDGNSIYDSRDNCNAIINTSRNELIAGCQNTIISNSVTSIGNYSFEGCCGITSVIIPNSVKSIGNAAFYGCTALTSVTIPNSVESIYDAAFEGCTALTSVTIPNSVTFIGRFVFECCNDLTSMVVEDDNTIYDSRDNCNAIINTSRNELIAGCRNTIIPNSVTSIGDCSFQNCTGLTSVVIPNSVTSIGKNAFAGCSGLTSVSIPNGVTTINYCTFSGCSGLTSVVIPNSVTSIGDWAFSDCSGLTSVTIPNSVTSIGECAFYGCGILTSVVIPNSVISIGNNAFSGCNGLESVKVPVIDYAAFCNNTIIGLIRSNISKPITLIDKDGNEIKEYIIPNGVTSIDNSTFYNCSGLTAVTIPSSVTSIGSNAFSGCSGLTSVKVPVTDFTAFCNNRVIKLISNSISKPVTLIDEDGNEIKEYVIPNSVTSIGNSAFYGCSGLTSVTIPNSVTSIGSSAFRGCSGLTSVPIPNSVTSIGDYVFGNCNNLSSITIPSSVTSIGYNTFSGCSGLENVTFHCPSIGSWFSDLTSIKEINIGDEVITIGSYAFGGCTGLTSVTIPNSVTSIGSSAFYNCSGLTSVTIPNSVTSIGSSAFSSCSSLTTVNINSLKEWISLSFPNVESNPLYFAHHLYLNGEEVKDMSIPSDVTAISARAFVGCTGLESVRIPNSVTEIGSGAFSGCDNLLTVNSEIMEPYNCSQPFSNNTYRKGTLNVPAGTKDLYIRFDGWREFLKIEEAGSNEPAVNTYVLTYMVDGKAYRTVNVEEGTAITAETAPYKEGYSFAGWKNLPTTMPASDLTVSATYTVNKYVLTCVVDNEELSSRNVEYGSRISVPSTDNDGNRVTWYSYPTTMPAHDLVVYGMVPKAAAPEKYTITYKLDGQTYRTVVVEEGATVSKEKTPYKDGYTFNGWQNEPSTMPGYDVTVNGTFSVNSYALSFIVDNEELETMNVEYGAAITVPAKDGEGNDITWYSHPTTMPAHDLVVYGKVVIEPEPEVFVWLTIKDGQGTTKMKVKQGAEQVLTILPEDGWKILSVAMDGTDVTAQATNGGSFTTPAINSDASIIIVYEQEVPSGVRTAHSQADVKVVSDGIVISNAEPETHCVIYSTDGQQVVNTVISEGTKKITLQQGQVYILTIDGRTLKFAL